MGFSEPDTEPDVVIDCGENQLVVTGWGHGQRRVSADFREKKFGRYFPRFGVDMEISDIQRLHAFLGDYLEANR